MKAFRKFTLVFALIIGIGFALPVSAQEVITLISYTNESFGYESLVPDGWTDIGNGIFTRQSDAGDGTLIAQQSAPLRPDALLNTLLPQLALTEAPESTGTYAGAALEWTLYQVDVSAGANSIKVDLGLAEADGTSYLVLFQTSPEEYETLHASVFILTLDAFAPLVSEATEEAVPYIVEDVSFANGDVTLAGTLTLPMTEGVHPVVVLVTGSGPQDRDESLGGVAIKPFRLLADALTRAGIAVLRYDDRGVGESSGDFATATTPDFASDAAAAIDYLLTREEINPDEIGLLGHSEGGLVAAMLGAGNTDLDFIVSLAGPGVNGRDVLLVQNRRLMEVQGAQPEQIEAQIAFLEQIFDVVGDAEAVETLAYEHTLQQMEALTEEQRASMGNVEDYARTVAAQSVQQYDTAWLGFFLSYDPAVDWAQTTVPVLALFGGKDVQVDAEQNAPTLEAALTEAGNPDFEIVTLPDANHLFQAAETGSPSEYGMLPAEFMPEFLPTLIEWIQARVTIVE